MGSAGHHQTRLLAEPFQFNFGSTTSIEVGVRSLRFNLGPFNHIMTRMCFSVTNPFGTKFLSRTSCGTTAKEGRKR
jgi:hypothetical protein